MRRPTLALSDPDPSGLRFFEDPFITEVMCIAGEDNLHSRRSFDDGYRAYTGYGVVSITSDDPVSNNLEVYICQHPERGIASVQVPRLFLLFSPSHLLLIMSKTAAKSPETAPLVPKPTDGLKPFPPKWRSYWELTRLHRFPMGTDLVFWPCSTSSIQSSL